MAKSEKYSTPQDADQAFYRAFESADIEAMMEVWAGDQGVTCIHPGSHRLQGCAAIKSSWQQIFTNGASLRFTLTDSRYTQDTHLAVHMVKENIRVDGVLQGVMLATNIYQFIDGSWRMMLHHASPEPQEPEQQPTQTLH